MKAISLFTSCGGCAAGANSCIEAIDLFCGAGGLTRGLEDAGVRVWAGYDIDSACRYPYTANNHAEFILKSVTEVTGAEVNAWFTPGAVRLLAGCAPCQPFSTLANTVAERDEHKWGLLGEFERLVREVQPELVTMENVPLVTRHAPYQGFVAALRELGYHVDARQLRCADLGLAQDRKRFVLVASRLGENLSLNMPTCTPQTVRQAIGALPRLEAGQSDPRDPLHRARTLTPLNLQRIRASTPGGTWHDWPMALRAPCHQAASGATYQNVYARMTWDKPAPTMTTQCYNYGSGRFGHPEQDRAISLREAAILQSFPQDYAFVPPGAPVEFSNVGRMIGYAVPPRLGFVVGQLLQKHLGSIDGKKSAQVPH